MLFVPEKALGWFSLALRVVTEDKPHNFHVTKFKVIVSNILLHAQRNCVAVGNATQLVQVRSRKIVYIYTQL